MSKRRYQIIQFYIAREFVLSFMVAFFFFFVIFFINQLLLMAEDILSKNAPLVDVMLLVLNAMPAIIAMSFPFASLVGSIMAISRFIIDNEFLVMRASGIAKSTVFLPFLFLGLIFSSVSFIANDYFLPLGTMNYAKIYRRLITAAPALELRPYAVKNYQGTVIVTGDMQGSTISNMVILDTTRDEKSRVITADKARLVDHSETQGVITLLLDGVFTQESSLSNPTKYEYSSADRMEYNILLSRFSDISTTIGPHEMRSIDVRRIILEKQHALDARRAAHQRDTALRVGSLQENYLAQALMGGNNLDNKSQLLRNEAAELQRMITRRIDDRSLYLYRLEYYKKFSIPFGALCFVFLSFPLSVAIKKSNRGAGFALGLLIAVAYWALLLGGQNFGLRTGFSAFWSMWLPNALVVGAGIILSVVHREH